MMWKRIVYSNSTTIFKVDAQKHRPFGSKHFEPVVHVSSNPGNDSIIASSVIVIAIIYSIINILLSVGEMYGDRAHIRIGPLVVKILS